MDKSNIPHAVYWMYNRQMELLYIGCSHNLLAHLKDHATPDITRNRRLWATSIAAVKVKWYSTRHEAQRAEARAIVDYKPKYNKYRWGIPNRSTVRTINPLAVCSRCGNPKQKSTSGYCTACAKAYQKDRHLRIQSGTWHNR